MKKLQSLALALCCLRLVVLFCGANTAVAQEVNATITGMVTDPSGAAVVGAAVTAKSGERGITYNGETNDAGIYRISQLPVGSYRLRIEKNGFQTSLYPTFVLHENQVARFDVELKVGQVSQTIEVRGTAPALKTEATQVDTIINAAANDDLPLASRNYAQLTLLAPGAVSTDPSSFTSGNNTLGYGARPLINGNREQANNFLLDGMDNNQVSDNLLGYTPAPDAIQEINIVTNNAPAEFGNFMGGIISATIKSGTSSFHGDVWEFLRNDVLNANSWSNNFNTSNNGQTWDPLPKDKVRWNMFGGTLGGPIVKNKLFFFADYQGQRFDIPSSSSTNTVFTAAQRTGDFSALCSAGFDASGKCLQSGSGNVQLYNPCVSFSVACTPSSPAATNRQIFPFNRIPLGMISPVAQNLFNSSLYPKAVGTELQQNAVNTTSSAFDVDQGDIKADYKPSEKDSISGRLTRAYQNNPSANSQVLLDQSYATAPIWNAVGDWTRMISSNLVSDARFGWSRITLNDGNGWAPSVGQFGNTLGIGNGNPGNLDGLLALQFANSYVSSVGQEQQIQSFDDHVWQAEDSVTWTRGRHTFKFGGQYFHQIIKTFYSGNNGELGYLNFDGRFTSNTIGGAATGAGDGSADFVLGLPDSYGRGTSTGQTWEQSSNIFSLYGQDTWHVTERLTLNLGLRYEAHTPWVETNDHQANYNITTGQIDLANQNGASRALYNGVYGGKDLQPRVGFAWTPKKLSGYTVVRGAFTISSYLEGTGTNLRIPLNPPFTPAEINTVYDSVALPATSLSDGIVGTATGTSCAAPTYACYAGTFLRVWDPNVQPAIDDQWNLTVQHQFWGSTTFQVGYLGQRAYHLMVPFDYAQRVLLPATASCPAPCTAPSPFFAKNPTLYKVMGNPSQNGEGAMVSGTQSNGTMMYNSLQAVLQKEMSDGLQYQMAYTYSKCMSDNSGYYGAWNNAISASPYWQNVYDKKAEWAPCYYDATHVISAYAIYELPFGRGRALGQNINKVFNAIVGGWSVSPIVSFRTGFPLAIAPDGVADQSGTYSRGERPDCNSIPTVTGETPITTPGVGGYQWFANNGNFTTPALGTFGSCPNQLGYLRTAHYTDVDLSVHKDFHLTERFKLQFRTDFINAFNHVQLNAPYVWDLGPSLGQVTSAQPPRNIQFALKLYY